MPFPPLDREEYIEQAYFFRSYRERLDMAISAQEILGAIHEEVLSTTKLPMAIDFLKGELLLHGRISPGMTRLAHYFAPFQAFVVARAEDEKSKFDFRTALVVLEREAEYRAAQASPPGLFIYQFECLSRNKLGFDRGMLAMADDPLFNDAWRDWIVRARLQIGVVDFADLIYARSEQALLDRQRRTGPDADPAESAAPVPLFAAKEGRIARANRGKDPLFMFAALQRQLGYPAVPRPPRPTRDDRLSNAALDARLQLLEKRLAILEADEKNQLDLSQFIVPPMPDV